ncbi:MAG TPA: hypothetical protein VIV11_05940 [Kofleriaceae bacterium]
MSTFACGHCGASLAFAGVRTETCPYCASPNFVERPPAREQPDPHFVVTFVGDAAVARRALDRWIGSRTLFADSALRRSRVEDIRGIYVPAYLYSAVAHTHYDAQIGENYTETETYTVTDEDGNRETRTRTVTRTEYRPLAGYHVSYVTDVIASASQGLANEELGRIEPFDLKQMRRFDHALVSGWIAEEFSWSSDECQRACRSEAVDQVGMKLRRFMPGDSYSDLSWRTSVAWEALDPIMIPVWVLALRYRDTKDPLRVVINGQTGKVAGKVPLSAWKVTIGIIVLAALIAAIAYLIYTRSR